MGWLHRFGLERRGSGAAEAEDASPGPKRPSGRRAPGLQALFEELGEDGGHTFLDLGVAEAHTLRLYGRYARRVRFAGLHPRPPHGSELRKALGDLSAPRGQPFDVILSWDVLDRLIPEERPFLLGRLVELSSPGGRLHMVVDASGQSTIQPLRFTPLATNRIKAEPVGPTVPAGAPLLPAEAERMLAPFRVLRGFTLRSGLREYVAVRP